MKITVDASECPSYIRDMMMWMKLADAVSAKMAKDGVTFRALEAETGLDKSASYRVTQRQPVNVENYLAICKWLNAHPSKFWSGDIRHDRTPG